MSEKREHGRREIVKKVNTAAWTAAGLAAAVVSAGAGLLFTAALNHLGMLPTKYLMPLLIILWVVIGVVCLLQFIRPMRVPSKVLAVILVLVLAAGSFVLGTMIDFLNTASDVTVSVDTMQVYVLIDDPAETINDAQDYEFGILTTLGRANTDEALETIEGELDTELSTTSYVSMLELAQALLDGEVQAILVNSAYLNIVDEDDNLADFADQVRVLASYDIERQLEIAVSSGSDAEEEETEEETVIDADNMSSFVVYISGNDASGTLKSTGRSDVNILMAVNPDTHTILLVNTPRDYYVELAGIGEYDKLTHAGIYGVDVSMNTLGNLYDVDVEYYARMNFTGFVEIIDALGGITVTSEYAFSTGSYDFVEGENTLDGEAALAFARERHAFASGDRQRGINQMAVITAVINKLASPAILTGYLDIMDAASGSFETNFTSDEIAELVKFQLSYGGGWTVETISADGTGGYSSVYSAQSSSLYVMYPDDSTVEAVKEALQTVLNGE